MAKNIEIDLIINTAGSEKSVAQAKQAIRELNNELKRLGPEADDAFVNKVNSAISQTKAQLQDLQDDINSVRPDKIGQAFINVGSTIASSLQLAGGALAAFGLEGEKLEETQTKLLAISNVAGGLANLSETTEDFSRSFKVLNNVVKSNPIIFIVSAIIGVFTILASKSQALQKVLSGVFKVFEILGDGIDKIISLTSGLIDSLFGLETSYADLTAEARAAAAANREFQLSQAGLNSQIDIAVLKERLLKGEIDDKTFAIESAREAREQADREADEAYQKELDNLADLRKNLGEKEKEEVRRREENAANARDTQKSLNESLFNNAVLEAEKTADEIEKREKEQAEADAKRKAEERERENERAKADRKRFRDEFEAEIEEINKAQLNEFQKIAQDEFDAKKELQDKFDKLTKAEQELKRKDLEEGLRKIELDAIQKTEELKKQKEKEKLDKEKDLQNRLLQLQLDRLSVELDNFKGTEEERLVFLKEFQQRQNALLDQQQANELQGVEKGSVEYNEIVFKYDKLRLETRKEIGDQEVKVIEDQKEKEKKAAEERLAALNFAIDKTKEAIGIASSLAQTAFAAEESRLKVQEQQDKDQYERRKKFIELNIQDETARTRALEQLDAEFFSKDNALQKQRIELQKKQIKFERNVAVATIALDTAKALANNTTIATQTGAASGPAGPVVFALTLAAGIAAIIAAISKAKNALKEADASGLGLGGGTGGGAVGGINLSNLPQQLAPQPALQQLGAFTQNEQGQFQVFVSETDITSVVNRVQVIESRASFG